MSLKPDWIDNPCNTINDILEERNIKVSAFSEMLGLSVKDTEILLQGKYCIDYSLALKLSITLGSTPEFWYRRQKL